MHAMTNYNVSTTILQSAPRAVCLRQRANVKKGDLVCRAAKQMTTDCLKQLKYRLKSDKILDQRRPVTLISAR
jgi:hypothetical protein